jgi:hypothetical protein
MTPPKLTVDGEGRVQGANVAHNSPWPCKNGDSGGMSVPANVQGVIMHTMVGDLPGTISWFNNGASEASAHFGVDQAGNIHQFGPVNGWKAWAEGDGNSRWFSLEFADAGHPEHPLTQAQIDAGGQLLECLSAPSAGRFTMQLTDSAGTEGLGWHGMGGQDWGGHFDCPGNVRKGQRQAVLQVAQAIRGDSEAPQIAVYICEGQKSLNGLADQLNNAASTLLRLTAEKSPGGVFTGGMADYLNDVFTDDKEKVPEGVTVYHPDGTKVEPFNSHGTQTLLGLALAFKCQPSAIVRLTAKQSPGAVFEANMAQYLNDVFSRSDTHVPKGAHLYYQK